MGWSDKVDDLHEHLYKIWSENLEDKDVVYPGKKSPLWLPLLCLFENEGIPVKQKEIGNWVERNSDQRYDGQARHLSTKGWYVESGNSRSHNYNPNLKRDELVLVLSDTVNPRFGKKRRKKKDYLKAYYQTLRRINLQSDFSYAERCENWLDIFRELQLNVDQFQWDSYHTPELLALVHPNEYFDGRGEDISNYFETSHSKKGFGKKTILDERCQIGDLIDGIKCPYVKENGVQMDHLWPHSLGGPTHNSNMIYLCKTCNQQKSSSPLYFSFETCPSWLVNRIKTMVEQKSRIWND